MFLTNYLLTFRFSVIYTVYEKELETKKDELLKVIIQTENFFEEDPDLEDNNYFSFTQQVNGVKDLSGLEKISTDFINFFQKEVQKAKGLTSEKKTILVCKNTITEIMEAIGGEKSTPETSDEISELVNQKKKSSS